MITDDAYYYLQALPYFAVCVGFIGGTILHLLLDGDEDTADLSDNRCRRCGHDDFDGDCCGRCRYSRLYGDPK